MANYTVSATQLCTIAVSDAKHDFGVNMVDVSRKTIPPMSKEECISIDEDGLLHSIGIDKINNIFKITNSSSEILKEYTMFPEILYGELFDKLNSVLGSSIYFVVDTYNESFQNDLSDLRNGPLAIKHYWVQNRQTLYDPAGKTNERTGAGKRIFTGNSNLVFSWEDNRPGMTKAECYPSWEFKTNSIDINTIDTTNILFYCKNTIYQVLEQKTETDATTQTTKCIMQTPTGIIVANKQMATINGGNIAKGEYSILKESVKNFIIQLFGQKQLQKLPTYTDEHHCPLKRLGDQGQALSCTKKILHLRNRFSDNHKSNGNHAFVTIDRPALVAALTYRVPIVIYCYKNGGYALFIHNSIQTPEKRLINAIRQYNVLYDIYDKNDFVNLNNNINILVKNKKYLSDDINSLLIKYARKFVGLNMNNNTLNNIYKSFIKDCMYILRRVDIYNSIPDSFDEHIKHSRQVFQYTDSEKNENNINNALNSILKEADYVQELHNMFIKITKIVDIINKKTDMESAENDIYTNKNIDGAFLFTEGSRSERIFISKKEEYSLALYISTIYKSLINFDNVTAELFLGVIKNIMKRVQRIDGLYYITLYQHIRNVLININGISISDSILGGVIEYNEDEYMRTLFGVICMIINTGTSITHNIDSRIYNIIAQFIRTNENNIRNMAILIYNDMSAYSDELYNISSHVSPYYIDFFTAQVNNYPELLDIYNLIISTGDIYSNSNTESSYTELIEYIKHLVNDSISEYLKNTPTYDIINDSLKKYPVKLTKYNNIAKKRIAQHIKKYSNRRNKNISKRRHIISVMGGKYRKTRKLKRLH